MATNRPQGDPQQRVSCPNCHANNFVGQGRCWQCQVPLSAAGAGQAHQAVRAPVFPPQAQPLPQGQPAAFARATSARPHPFLLIGIAMLTFVIVLLVARSRSGSGLPASSMQPGQAMSPRLNPDVTVQPSAPDNQTTAASGAGGDPVEEAARRAVSREAPNVGLPPPPIVSPDGKVHLRTGGTISPDEYNEARSKLKDSPLLKDPPAPPPF